MLSDAALMINTEMVVVAMNSSFSEIGQVTEDQILNQNLDTLSDTSLVQSLKELVVLAQESGHQTHTKDLHFSQFTCSITMRALYQGSSSTQPEFYFVVFQKKSEGES